MTPSEILIAAKGLIDAPEKWCQGEMAMKEDWAGQVDLYHPEAKCFCITGAMKRTAEDEFALMRPAYYLVEAIGGRNDVALWNDAPERTWEEVMEAFDRAIAAAREAGE